MGYSKNEVVEAILFNNIKVLRKIADLAEKQEHTVEHLIEYMREVADEMDAQILVVQLRDKDYIPK